MHNSEGENSKSLNMGPASRAEHSTEPDREPIAITGIGCRFPGADGPEAFWHLLSQGVDAISDIPSGRFDIDSVYDPTPGTPGKIINRTGGFLKNVDHFDAAFFGISPREALRLDPQQRLLLEVTWEALEDAGQVPGELAASKTGVFIGACTSDYEDIQYYLRDREGIDIYVATGTARAVMSGRLSYAFDLLGPSFTVDTACSSSLVAVHLACQSLWAGESSLALAGGVNLILLPEMSMSFSSAKMLAPDGRCKFGDANANGFTRSDGVGVVVLKPLSKAQADGDRVYAVIRGTAINNDGRSSGLLATPSREGQKAALREAYRNAGVSPGCVQYVEAHGTGTSVGDPVEVESLGEVLAEGRDLGRPCVVGSVKTNIGHTEGAAGIAGLIKVALSLKHRAIPPSLHFREPNPNIRWNEIPLVVSDVLTPFEEGSEPITAGVSAFGISATNAHVVLQEAPRAAHLINEPPASDSIAQLLTLSARNPQALDDLARAYVNFSADIEADLRDLCYSVSVRRSHLEHRLALVARSREQLAESLEGFLQREFRAEVYSGCATTDKARKIAFVFPGQGGQWLGMGRQLFEQEPIFRNAIERCDEAFKEHVSWSLLEEFNAGESQSRLNEIDVVQPFTFAIQVALAALWRHWGIEPDAVVGQSLGEVAAAHVSGALSLEDAARVICRRSLLVKRMTGRGGMAVVGLAMEEAERELAGYEDRLSIAVNSSPTSTVLSGDVDALKEVLASLNRRGIFCQIVKVDFASHSPQMDPLKEDLLSALDGLDPRPPSTHIYSTVTGDTGEAASFDPVYWMRNLREPVLFSRAIQRLVEDGHLTFLEVSPHPLLASPINQVLKHVGREGRVLPSMRNGEDERAVVLGSLGALYAEGYSVNWARVYSGEGQYIPLPTYPWQRERFWLGQQEATGTPSNRQAAVRRDGIQATGRLLSTTSLESAAHPGTYFWEFDLSTESSPYLNDHQVQGEVVLPGAAYVEMALGAASEVLGEGSHYLENVNFRKALFLSPGSAQKAQLVISPDMTGRAKFEFFSLETSDVKQSWALHASGLIGTDHAPFDAGLPGLQSPEQIQARCQTHLFNIEHYELMSARGLHYGPSFQGVEQLWRRDGEAIGQMVRRRNAESEARSNQPDATLLDACFQVLAAAVPDDDDQAMQPATYLPVGIDSLRAYDSPALGAWSHATFDSTASPYAGTLSGNVYLLDDQGRVVLEARGLSMQRLDRSIQDDEKPNTSDWFYKFDWQPSERRGQNATPASDLIDRKGCWVVFADTLGVGQAVAELLKATRESCITVTPGDEYRKLGLDHYQLDPADAEAYKALVAEVLGPGRAPCRGVVHLWSLEDLNSLETSLATLDDAQRLGCNSVLLLAQALAIAEKDSTPHLWLVTGGAQAIGEQVESVSFAQSPLWGLGRVISQEHPELRCTIVDLSSDPEAEAQNLFLTLLEGDEEDQIALRGKARYVARLVKQSSATENAANSSSIERVEVTAEQQPYALDIATPGVLDDLTLRATRRGKPAPGEVEIQVFAVGINFRDVMLAIDVLPSADGVPQELGWECAGKIVAIGDEVEGFRIGDEVLAIASPCYSAFAITPASLVFHKPAHLSFEEAATIPIAFLTANYALNHLARLREGERVLIHAASGGVGLAAVRLAQRAGAEIFATASSPEKKSFLESLGVRNVFDSRSLAFVDGVMKATGGEGIDVVLNSLAGEAIPAGLSLLRAGGRFLELGRRDIYHNAQLGLRPFHNNLSFHAIDLALLIQNRPSYMGSVLREVMHNFEGQSQSPLPLHSFSMGEVASAFRFMAQAKHIGKVVVRVKGEKVAVAPSVERLPVIRDDATYLVTGGLGGLGLSIARWMVSQGARHLVLMSRSDGSEVSKEILDELKRSAEVVVAKADASKREQVAKVIAAINGSMPPLRGVVHSAGCLDDGILLHMNRERFDRVMAPKVSGAWNLHALTLSAPLDFFVLFSSAASMLGSPGQANYSAANAFLDQLSHYRRSQGLPSLSINWGPWSEVGLAARPDRGGRLAIRGINSIAPAQGIEALELLLCQREAQVGVMPFNIDQWSKYYPAARTSPLFSELGRRQERDDTAVSVASARIATVRESLLEADDCSRQATLDAFLKEKLARVLGFSASKLSGLDVNLPVNRLGIDSLMAVELKTLIEAELGVVVPIVSFLKGSSLAQLAAEILDKLAETTYESQTRMPSEANSAEFANNMARAVPANDQWEELSI
jgi:acyl transferase domain-containing protein/acyl carrier protein